MKIIEKLTIAIPTYNRRELLLKNVMIILKNSKNYRILIIDNATPNFGYEDFKRELGPLYLENIDRIDFIKNRVNIGMNANVLKCIEHCKTDYIWIVGDDDFLLNNFELITDPLLYKGYAWILFHQKDKFQPTRAKSKIVLSLESFLDELKSINELVFCSVNIYNTSYLKAGLEYSYENLNIMAPHLVAMIAGIEKHGDSESCFLISKEEILESVSNNKDGNNSWPLYRAFLGIYKLPGLEFRRSTRILLKVLVRNSRKKWLNNKSLIYSMATLSEKKGIIESYRISNGFMSSAMNIGFVWSFFSNSLYIFSIIFGKQIIKLNNYRRSFNVK